MRHFNPGLVLELSKRASEGDGHLTWEIWLAVPGGAPVFHFISEAEAQWIFAQWEER